MEVCGITGKVDRELVKAHCPAQDEDNFSSVMIRQDPKPRHEGTVATESRVYGRTVEMYLWRVAILEVTVISECYPQLKVLSIQVKVYRVVSLKHIAAGCLDRVSQVIHSTTSTSVRQAE